MESIIRKAIRERLGFDVPTLALPQDTLRKIIDNNPFSHQEADKKDSITLCSQNLLIESALKH
ncbi:MAG: DUF1697 domain-containing protein [Candidatus Parvibacillus calidus]|nr:MAG: DUF1697 domain-containing protein [Candidatus Parvibacillus calidus]